ncbi:hydroxypyruvate isomerase (plasmid) [Azospirillum argentinense]|uniref:Hydroxypyruvate isomerase n=1 Tax=Azospirillum argentinense TaxID=2970906 RepID=A0A4D8PSY0_9PROT|nr:2-oxo-tetronate isomerase [Azospirillum argentinense]QCN98239.1 hydroxypyruvate isomerase [Azospirillum argentinense]
MRFAANLSMMFTERPFLERFGAAAAAGFDAVEFLFPYDVPAERIKAALDAHGLTQALFNLPPGDWAAGERGIASLPGREAEFREGVATAIAYAKVLGNRLLHGMAGIPPQGMDREEALEVYTGNLRHAAAACAEAGLTLLVEPINNRDMPGYLMNGTALARRVIETVEAPNLKLQLDLYHCQISEGDLATRIRANADLTAHVQIAGVPDRQEPDRGEVNYPYLFEVLADTGYRGFVGCEYRPRARTEDGLGWLHAASTRAPR